MKPILFAANSTIFTSNGLGSLDPAKCEVTEERNGQYELECVVPTESAHFSDIANNMILVVIPGDGNSVHAKSQRQAFRIYHITEPLNGLVTINARHISYDLSYNTVMPFTASTISTALGGIASNMVESNTFTFNTDKTTSATFKVTVPQTARQLLGGQAGSILDVYGGEYDWDNYTVNLWSQRGTDAGVTLRYGKNITDISQEENLENVVTGIVPYWANEDTVVTLTEKSVDSAYASSYPYKRTVPVDFSSEWEDAPTESQLRNRAQSYITANKIGVPKVSIKVSFVALWQTDEYKSIAPLERVHLCDTVGVVFEKYGINARAKVIKTVWDCLAERYLSIELGEAHSNFAKTIVNMNDQTETQIVETKTVLQNAIDSATAAINGANGGYLVIEADADGHPQRMLIMDNPDKTQAHIVWQYNSSGWGVSVNGINGPYLLAATLDPTYGAALNASYIRAGKMSCDYLEGGIFQSKDANHKFYVNMNDGSATLDGITLKDVAIDGLQGVNTNLGTLGLAFYRKSNSDYIGAIAASIASNVKHMSILGDTDTTLDIGSGRVEISSSNGNNTAKTIVSGEMSTTVSARNVYVTGSQNVTIEATSSNIGLSSGLSIIMYSDQNIDMMGDAIMFNCDDLDVYDSDDDTYKHGYSTTMTILTGDNHTFTIEVLHGIIVNVSFS